MREPSKPTRKSRAMVSKGVTRKDFLKFGGSLAVASAAVPLVSACEAGVAQSGSGGAEYTLKVADSYPVGHPVSEGGAKYFMERATELTDGRVRFDYFPAEQMGAAENLADLVQSGVVEIAMIGPAYEPAKLPLSGVGDLPAMAETSREGSLAAGRLMSEGGILFREEFAPNDIRPLVVGLLTSYEAMTGDALVKVPDEVRGLQLRSAGGSFDLTMEAIGATAVAMDTTEMYEAMSRGTVDGVVLAPMSATPYRMEEVLGHSTMGAQLGSFTSTYSISERIWDQLPDDIQGALLEAGADATRNLSATIDRANEAARQQMKDGGVRLYDLSSQEKQVWRDATRPVQDRWAEDMESIGRSGEEALRAMHEALESVREQSE